MVVLSRFIFSDFTKNNLFKYNLEKMDPKSEIERTYSRYTPDRQQSKTLLTIDERGSKIDRNSVFDCHLSPVGRQMAIENSVSDYF